MKHLHQNGTTCTCFSDNLLKKIFAIIAYLLLVGFQNASGQCSMTSAAPDPIMPVLLYANADCRAAVKAETMLISPFCTGVKVMTIRDQASNIVVIGTDSVQFNTAAYLNQILSVTITDEASGIFSVGFVSVLDTIAPTLFCQDVTVSCIDGGLDVVEYPEVSDNCSGEVELTYEDDITHNDCIPVVQRTWTARDKNGNVSTCTQTVSVEKPTLDQVVFPNDTTLSCDDANVFTAVLGFPSLEGKAITNGTFCNLFSEHVDKIESLCGMIEFEIQRIWTVEDICTGLIVQDTQRILILDDTPPNIVCPQNLTVAAEAGKCHATVTLPTPTVTDNCDNAPTFYVSTSFGAVGVGPHPLVPVGTHTIQYLATDACGNTKICNITLTVTDSEAPTAICESFTAIALPALGYAVVDAKTFNKGSADNCASQLYYKVRKMTTGSCEGINGDDDGLPGYQEWFDDDVIFCCEEVKAGNVTVLLRVYEVNPSPGPVDPTREIPGGDLYGRFTECMVQVELQDKLPPILECPQDVTIDCTTDYSDLSIFGKPILKDNCQVTLDSTIQENLNECGVGTIVRTYKATDKAGNETICSQTITVINNNPLKMEDIEWPKLYTTNECGAATDPEDLPEGYQEPIIKRELCGLVGVNHRDQLFDLAFPACYKILRTWEVIDWCKYDPEFPEAGGKFTHIQTIKVEDLDAPVLNCPADVTVGVGNSCGTTLVTLPPVTAVDCNPNVLITNDSPYAISNGANASGNYPVGTTIVTFTAKDRCGNTSICKVKVTVEDKTPPSPICIVGLSVNLSNMNGTIMATINAKAFDGGSSDNCTAKQNLKLFIRKGGSNVLAPPSTTELTFTCEELGNRLIEFWVVDEKGNSDHCLTYLAVQDNNGLCPKNQNAVGTIAGDIKTEKGSEVENVMVKVNNLSGMQSYTGQNGYFQFPGIPFGHDYSIVPERNDDAMNGVSTLDIVLISKHILGTQKFNSPYKIIAADVDKSNSITTLDLVKIRKMILGIENKMPNGNKSWRFVSSTYVFPNPENPFQSSFPEIYNVNNFNRDMLSTNFVAIKIGDVNGSATSNNLGNVETRAAQATLQIEVEDKTFKAGETFAVALNIRQAMSLLGYQFGVGFDTEALELTEVAEGSLPDMSLNNFGLYQMEEGWLTTSWNAQEALPIERSTTLFTLYFTAKTDATLSNALYLSPRAIKAEAYADTQHVMDIALQFVNVKNETSAGEGFELYQNIPNPFSEQTTIAFRLPQAGAAKLTIFDATGKVIFVKAGNFEQGHNEIVINRGLIAAKGMLYYRLESNNLTATRKMLIVD